MVSHAKIISFSLLPFLGRGPRPRANARPENSPKASWPEPRGSSGRRAYSAAMLKGSPPSAKALLSERAPFILSGSGTSGSSSATFAELTSEPSCRSPNTTGSWVRKTEGRHPALASNCSAASAIGRRRRGGRGAVRPEKAASRAASRTCALVASGRLTSKSDSDTNLHRAAYVQQMQRYLQVA